MSLECGLSGVDAADRTRNTVGFSNLDVALACVKLHRQERSQQLVRQQELTHSGNRSLGRGEFRIPSRNFLGKRVVKRVKGLG